MRVEHYSMDIVMTASTSIPIGIGMDHDMQRATKSINKKPLTEAGRGSLGGTGWATDACVTG